MVARGRATFCTLVLALAGAPAAAQDVDLTMRAPLAQPLPYSIQDLPAAAPYAELYEPDNDLTTGHVNPATGDIILQEGESVWPHLNCDDPSDIHFNTLLEKGIVDQTPFLFVPKGIYRSDVWSGEFSVRLDDSYTYCRYRCFTLLPPEVMYRREPAQEIAEVARWVKDHPDQASTIPYPRVGPYSFGVQNLPVAAFTKRITDTNGNTISITYWDRNSCGFDTRTCDHGPDGIFGPHDALEVAVVSPSGVQHFVDFHLNGFLRGNVTFWDNFSHMRLHPDPDKGELSDSTGRHIV